MEPLATGHITPERFEEYIESDGCENVGGPQYARALYTFAEAVKAREILECGLGWGWSGFAFSASMSGRGTGRVTSLDPHEPRGAITKLSAVDWRHIYTPSQDYEHDADLIDLLYVDGDPARVHDDVRRFRGLVKNRGLIVVDGYGAQGDVTRGVKQLIAEGMDFGMVPYSEHYAHAVHMVER